MTCIGTCCQYHSFQLQCTALFLKAKTISFLSHFFTPSYFENSGRYARYVPAAFRYFTPYQIKFLNLVLNEAKLEVCLFLDI